jgi:folylpolyglutamate synthase/dihydropteroate synthase
MPADELAERWRRGAPRVGDVTAIDDPLEALERARARGGPTIVAGSLYLVGAIRGRLLDDPELRDPPEP